MLRNDKPSVGSSEWFTNTIQSLNLISNHLLTNNADLKALKIQKIISDLQILSEKNCN